MCKSYDCGIFHKRHTSHLLYARAGPLPHPPLLQVPQKLFQDLAADQHPTTDMESSQLPFADPAPDLRERYPKRLCRLIYPIGQLSITQLFHSLAPLSTTVV